jgi:putative ABC transport system permease protein
LFGLVSILGNQRKKEIGIRKVLGASSKNIVYKLSSEFFQLICIASVLAFVTSYFLMNEWLQNFAYRIDMTTKWWVFLLIFIVLLVFVMLIVSVKALFSARINPIDNLRCE